MRGLVWSVGLPSGGMGSVVLEMDKSTARKRCTCVAVDLRIILKRLGPQRLRCTARPGEFDLCHEVRSGDWGLCLLEEGRPETNPHGCQQHGGSETFSCTLQSRPASRTRSSEREPKLESQHSKA